MLEREEEEEAVEGLLWEAGVGLDPQLHPVPFCSSGAAARQLELCNDICTF